MKLWEIIKGADEGLYKNGDIFFSGIEDVITIYAGCLCWLETKRFFIVDVNEDVDWEKDDSIF